MDFIIFFDDLKTWMLTCNQKAVEYGTQTVIFWEWVFTSASLLYQKHNKHEVAKNQLFILIDFLERQLAQK